MKFTRLETISSTIQFSFNKRHRTAPLSRPPDVCRMSDGRPTDTCIELIECSSYYINVNVFGSNRGNPASVLTPPRKTDHQAQQDRFPSFTEGRSFSFPE